MSGKESERKKERAREIEKDRKWERESVRDWLLYVVIVCRYIYNVIFYGKNKQNRHRLTLIRWSWKRTRFQLIRMTRVCVSVRVVCVPRSCECVCCQHNCDRVRCSVSDLSRKTYRIVIHSNTFEVRERESARQTPHCGYWTCFICLKICFFTQTDNFPYRSTFTVQLILDKNVLWQPLGTIIATKKIATEIRFIEFTMRFRWD